MSSSRSSQTTRRGERLAQRMASAFITSPGGLAFTPAASLWLSVTPPARAVKAAAFQQTHESEALSMTALPPLPDLRNRAHLSETHAFTEEANWLIPQRCLLGRYPGSDPYLPCSKSEQRRVLHDLIARGRVGTFVCLQNEVPAQDDGEAWGPAGEVSYARSWKDPFVRYAPDAIEAAELLGRSAPRFVHFPVPDLDVVQPLSRLHMLVQSLTKLVLTKERSVYIHCWGGCGRTGIVASCLLGALYPIITADEAMDHVDAYFHLRSAAALRPHKSSPATQAQADQVAAYFRTYLKK